jgi:uncharacterized protein YecA (UPF0149 family)
MSPDATPPARPAAAAASQALARATSAKPAPLSPMLQPAVTNIVESSPTGTRAVGGGNGNGKARARPAGPGAPTGGVTIGAAGGRRKVGRNEPCPCGSGKKYKMCHGR